MQIKNRNSILNLLPRHRIKKGWRKLDSCCQDLEKKKKKAGEKTIRAKGARGLLSLSSEAMMSGEKRRLVDSSNKSHAYLPDTSYGTLAESILSQGREAYNISAFISQLDDTTRKRLDLMNDRLRQLEMQMEAIEAEVTKASEE